MMHKMEGYGKNMERIRKKYEELKKLKPKSEILAYISFEGNRGDFGIAFFLDFGDNYITQGEIVEKGIQLPEGKNLEELMSKCLINYEAGLDRELLNIDRKILRKWGL